VSWARLLPRASGCTASAANRSFPARCGAACFRSASFCRFHGASTPRSPGHPFNARGFPSAQVPYEQGPGNQSFNQPLVHAIPPSGFESAPMKGSGSGGGSRRGGRRDSHVRHVRAAAVIDAPHDSLGKVSEQGKDLGRARRRPPSTTRTPRATSSPFASR